MKSALVRFGWCGFASVVTVASVVAAAPVTNDVWDVSQGAIITASSGAGAAPLENMFGATGGPEGDRAFFRDDQPAGFTHFVEWRTPQPVLIDLFSLFAGDDNAANPGDRGFTQFRLFVKETPASTFREVFSFTPPSNPFPGHFITLEEAISPVIASEFRAEFDQFAEGSSPGPRIIELDGPPIPEPGALPLILGTAATILRRRRCQR